MFSPYFTASLILRRTLKTLTRAKTSIAAVPAIQMRAAADTAVCAGFTLAVISGSKLSEITGFTAPSIAGIPLFIDGVCE